VRDRARISVMAPCRNKRAIVANERQALELVHRMAASGKGEVSIRDIFGDVIDIALLESPLNASGQRQ
jgi:hypothetical protein